MTSKRIIIYLTPTFSPQKGGAATYFRMLSEWSIRNEKARYVIVLSSKAKNSKFFQKDGRLIIIRPFILANQKIPGRVAALMNFAVGMTLPFFLVLLKIIFINRKMLIHSHTRKHFLPLLCFAKYAYITSIVDIRDVGGIVFPSVTMNEITCSPLVPYIRPNSKYIPMPISYEELNKSNRDHGVEEYVSSGSEYYIYVGDIARRKGVDSIINVFGDHSYGYKDYNLLLIGRLIEPYLFEQVSGKNVQYLGELDWSKVIPLIKNSKGLLLPTRSDLFPRVVVEGLYLGKQVLITKAAISFVFMGHIKNLYIAESGDEVDIAECLTHMKDEYYEISDYKFSIHKRDEVLKQYEKLYDNI